MHPTFVLGCQRSGTTALLDTLALSPGLRTFSEGDAAVMSHFRLRPADQVRAVLAAGDGPAVLKPICDSHYADLILHSFPGAKVIWLFRQPLDVAGSMVRKWPGHMHEVMMRLKARDLDWLDWRSERLSADVWSVLDSHWHPDLNDTDAAALFWWLRNQWFSTQGLAGNPACVLLVRYEDLVRRPEQGLQRICRFVRTPYTQAMAESLQADHIGKDHDLLLAAPIARRCQALHAELSETLAGMPC